MAVQSDGQNVNPTKSQEQTTHLDGVIQERILADIACGNFVLASSIKSIVILRNNWGGKCGQQLLGHLLQVTAACAVASLEAWV